MSPPVTRLQAAYKGLARSVAAYERGRPGYPRAAVDFLARLRLGPGRTVVDLAAGTGKLTRLLLATGAEVVAVEPVAEMRAALPAGARTVDGTAEAMPLTTASADAVAVAQAFHWFDGDAALAEIHRVLRPGGALALVWNRRRMDEPLNQAIQEPDPPRTASASRRSRPAPGVSPSRKPSCSAARGARISQRATRRRRPGRPCRLGQLHRRARREGADEGAPGRARPRWRCRRDHLPRHRGAGGRPAGLFPYPSAGSVSRRAL